MKLIKPDVSIEEAMKEPEKWIPNGIYCYTPNCDGDSIFETTGYLCPFWDSNKNKPYMENGCCHYLKIEDDWNAEYLTLLWDMCKECDVNYD